MQYIRVEASGQLSFAQSDEFLMIPSRLAGFHNTQTSVKTARSGRSVYCHSGTLDLTDADRKCECGSKMHINSHPLITLRHLCTVIGESPHQSTQFTLCALVDACYLPRSPHASGSVQTAALLQQLHRNLTFPPSLWPDRELRKYHYPSVPVVALPVATRSLLQQSDRSALCVVADLQTGLEVLHLIAQGMYLTDDLFCC